MTGPGERIRVLIADDQQVVRGGLVLLIGMLDGIEVVGAARDGAEAVELTERLRPDVVLDLNMPVLDGVAATAALREKVPGSAVLVLTTYVDDDSVFPALRAGARGYLTKDADDDEVETAIRHVHARRTWLDPVVQARLVAALQPDQAAPTATPPHPPGSARRGADTLPDGLPPREAEVLTLIAHGPVQRRDLRPARRQPGHREDAHQPDLREDRRSRPRPVGALRLPERPGGCRLNPGRISWRASQPDT
ncbi:hypothetical protein SSPO_026500 [Streptomyces antimycoticus]|uniref:Response regulatory domain-containing protein n=1 Tax=Streptomyces antimycoticus TaxID=68175 RepID=A0A499UH45_9ACTN|nr:hypothetical protein SSPO_026500 [Streptomyces antimycoticus]